jgi:hypothetical protein
MNDSVEQLKSSLMGEWVSVAPEVRPSPTKNADGTIKPFYLRRAFTYHPGDRFGLAIVNSVDPYGQIPLARIVLGGHMVWRGAHPIAAGAQRVDFIADDAYDVTPLAQAFADVLNRIAREGFVPWQVNSAQSVLGKTFAPFGLVAGKHFQECDLVYLRQDLLFWGARHVDGRGFDSEENRPTNLQIPLVRG